ncbi:phage tail protein [Klebsiella variicola]
MSQTVITSAFEQLKAQEAANGGVVILDEFVFANVPNLDITSPIDRGEGLPDEALIVHRQAVGKTGMVNNNAVVYSVVMGADVGDFDFNWVGLVNKANNVVAMIVHAPTQKKIKTATGQQGNVLTRSFLMEYNGASEQTQIITPADTWQIDFTARLNGVDERIRCENMDIYGEASFLGDGFLVSKAGSQYVVKKGVGYVAGVRTELLFDQNITVSQKPVKVWADVAWKGTLTSVWASAVKLTVAETLENYTDNDEQHYVYALALISSDGSITDLRASHVNQGSGIIAELSKKQPLDATLTALAALPAGKDKLPFFTGDDEAGQTDITEVGRGLLACSSAPDIVEYLELSDFIDGTNRALNYVMPEFFTGDDTEQLLAAVSHARATGKTLLTEPGKTYYLTGNAGLDIDLGYFSFGPIVGRSKIDATGFNGPYALWIHSSVPYELGERNNHNKMRGIDLQGGIKGIKQAGWLWGNNNDNNNGTYTGQCYVEDCSVDTFDFLIKCTNSSWRYKVHHCGFTTYQAGTAVIDAPEGLLDSGESITFNDCQFFDSKGTPISIGCDNFSIGFPGTSILNTPVKITGRGVTMSVTDMGNIENPNAKGWYRYVEVTGIGSRFILSASTLVCNQPNLQTRPLFYVGSGAFISFTNVRFSGNAYQFQSLNPEGLRTFVEGSGTVCCTGCISDIGSGVGNIPVHRSISRVFNGNFEKGTLTGWSVNKSGSPSQTAEAKSDAAKNGSYGARLNSITGLRVFATQKVRAIVGEYFMSACWARVVSGSQDGGPGGQVGLTFYAKDDSQISGFIANLPAVETDWKVYGAFLCGIVPVGTEYAEFHLMASDGAIVDFDDLIINFV